MSVPISVLQSSSSSEAVERGVGSALAVVTGPNAAGDEWDFEKVDFLRGFTGLLGWHSVVLSTDIMGSGSDSPSPSVSSSILRLRVKEDVGMDELVKTSMRVSLAD